MDAAPSGSSSASSKMCRAVALQQLALDHRCAHHRRRHRRSSAARSDDSRRVHAPGGSPASSRSPAPSSRRSPSSRIVLEAHRPPLVALVGLLGLRLDDARGEPRSSPRPPVPGPAGRSRPRTALYAPSLGTTRPQKVSARGPGPRWSEAARHMSDGGAAAASPRMALRLICEAACSLDRPAGARPPAHARAAECCAAQFVDHRRCWRQAVAGDSEHLRLHHSAHPLDVASFARFSVAVRGRRALTHLGAPPVGRRRATPT